MAVELYSKVIARQVATALYPLLANVGTYVLKNLIQAVVNIAIRRPVNITDLQIDKSIFRDLSVLKSDSKDRWNHVFTNKYGHVKPQTDEERGVVALALEMVRKLGERVPILSKAAEPFKRKFELYFKDSNSFTRYSQSDGVHCMHNNFNQTNVDISELNSLQSTCDYVIDESYNVQSQSNCFGHSYDYFNKSNVDVS
ncbi:unnamed protein product [Rotaria sordida]|uniref:Uncharacterized protein n=1 Tax=Rotaria sordida TaxID=392033 RepID=A0A819X3A1_9BILA|nr:unnamed protein product [Rotaria sordida]CAF0974447.1 unnamed protein product [Rotaria sordida]CAF3626198.1 unnamed protein product [Rotaria sordida]CAF4134554.1 unnamed protein product [Rotaria sordida]